MSSENKHKPIGLCQTKADLLKAYQQATLAYSDAVVALNPTATSHATYETLFRRVEQAELNAMRARLDLENHIAQHGC